jgi:alpha-galactosidase
VGTEYAADSAGDGLLEHSRACYDWLCEISRKYPDLIIENCASGGMRIDYKQLSILSIQSTSDQTNYLWNANIASKAATGVLPEQSAVWAYPRGEADENTVVMNMVNALLQRIHLSGKIFDWSDWQMDIVKEGIECYKTYRHEIPESIPFYPTGIPHASDKFFCSAYKTPSCIRLGAWRMDSESDTFFIPLDTEYANARVRYPLDSFMVAPRSRGAGSCSSSRYSNPGIAQLAHRHLLRAYHC